MNSIAFESKLLPDGHLYCPKEIANKKNARFKVIAIFEDDTIEASDQDIELAAIIDNSDEFLSQEEIDALWAEEAERRVEEIQTGKVKPIDGKLVFKKIQGRFSK